MEVDRHPRLAGQLLFEAIRVGVEQLTGGVIGALGGVRVERPDQLPEGLGDAGGEGGLLIGARFSTTATAIARVARTACHVLNTVPSSIVAATIPIVIRTALFLRAYLRKR